ncbi:MAG: ATP-binding protein [Deltaproteobacteria bacterium]|nr:ATP-binding protein [Deltaproteobacteria bacterium]
MHHLRDFKSFRDSGVDLFRHFGLLIGKNGSGKSNAIEGIELLAELAQGRPLYEISDVRRGNGSFQVRGGLPACSRHGTTAFSLGLAGTIGFMGRPESFSYEMTIETRAQPRFALESLDVGRRTLFSAAAALGRPDMLDVRFDNFAQGGNKPHESLAADRSVLSRYDQFTLERPKLRHASRAVRMIREYLRASFVFDPQPKLMRAYERIGNRVLTRDGSNLSAVLYALRTGTEQEQATLSRIVERVRQVPEEPFEDVDFVTTVLNDVMLSFTAGGQGTDARLLSDGTLRCLAVLTAVETVAQRSRVILEEFDNGLHSSRVGGLAAAISETAERRHLSVLCTTHNPATLNALTREQLEGVVLCIHESEHRASRMVRLLDLPRSDVLLERGALGDLVSRRALEEHLMRDYEASQKQRLHEWLESLP